MKKEEIKVYINKYNNIYFCYTSEYEEANEERTNISRHKI